MKRPSIDAAAAIVPVLPDPAAPSRAEIERAVARGRCLQGEALRAAFRTLLRPFAAVGLGATADLPPRHHPCC